MPHIYMSFLPLMRHGSVVARHYARSMKRITCVEYIGENPNPAFIKEIDVDSNSDSISFSLNGKSIVSGSSSDAHV